MNISDEIAKLQNLHERGALTDDEFAQAKARVLAGESGQTDSRVQAQLDDLRAETDLARLDHEWEQQRQQYLVRGRYGRQSLPTQGGSLIGGIVVVGFGLFWTFGAASSGAPVFFPLFGILFIIFGIVTCVSQYGKANGYQSAEGDYQRRRAELLKRRAEAGGD